MKIHVLIVDDDSIILMLHSRNVKKSGLSDDPVSCLNGKIAIEYLDRHMKNNDICLVLLDINMPVMNGWDFLDELEKKGYRKNVNVAIVTSSVDSADRVKAGTYDRVFAYFEKPVNAQVIDIIKETEPFSEILE